ncbi:hypothetical protein [Thiohalophilus thiocyanatoxydans]|uniref:Uracil DNA glycosylase superfamily protein n=1 Tax=Thiohalophilus thiocyanatoxydans TaxID=381308 RepID=A0A4R8IQ49_9GAMM|nr:hypothetical protein [Thiohalophilus thiocyanatoxydans]TDY03006.1 hypothetical protein EDC23_1390 [Thiohalophilus thiocyanatoxydans]
MWHHVKVHPWIGENYHTPKELPFRTLIIGESNYTAPEAFSDNLVVNCVRTHLGHNDDPNFSRFATKIRKLACLSRGTLSREAFWNDVAFYNFVQVRVGEVARDRPTDDMWRESVAAFGEITEAIRPQRIWVLGKTNWNHFIRHVRHSHIDPHVVELPSSWESVFAWYTNHPSSGISYEKWSPLVARLLFGQHNNALQPMQKSCAPDR